VEQIDGDVIRSENSTIFPIAFDKGDLVHWKMNGGPGFGDPLERPVEKIKDDFEAEIYTPDVVDQIYCLVGEYDEDE